MNRVILGLYAVLLLTAAAWGLWTLLKPLLPYVVALMGIVFVYSFIFNRRRW